MAASDNLHPVEFHRERSKADLDQHLAEGDAAGRDVDEDYGYDPYNMSDAQWNRRKHTVEKEVF